MKPIKTVIFGTLIVSAVAGTILQYYLHKITKPIVETTEAPVIAEIPVPEAAAEPTPPAPEKVPVPVVIAEEPVLEIIIPATPPPQPTPEEQRLAQHRRYWENISSRFNNKMDRLANETDPRKRRMLIQQIAPYVRMDTLATLDWVSTLNTPEEQKKALEEINKHALVGIGAKIERDETGLPTIRDTTVLGAIESSGKVQPGDRIAGVMGDDGNRVNFKDMSMAEVVKYLRGKPGTDVQLVMERASGNETEQFNLTISRSMIIMEPPF